MLGSQRSYRAGRVKGGHASTEVDRGIPTAARGGPTPAHTGRSPPHRAAAIVDQHFHSGPSISLILSLSRWSGIPFDPPASAREQASLSPRLFLDIIYPSKLIPDNWLWFYGGYWNVVEERWIRWFDDPSSRESSFDDGAGSKRRHGSARKI